MNSKMYTRGIEMANHITADLSSFKYHAEMHENGNTGKLRYAFGNTLTEVRANIYWSYYQVGTTPIVTVYTRRTTAHPYGSVVANVSVIKRPGMVAQLTWEPKGTKKSWDECKIINPDGTLGPMIKTILQNYHYKG